MKKVISLLLSVLLVAGLFVTAAAVEADVLSLGRVAAVMPHIQVELRGTGYTQDQVEATLDGRALRIDSMEPYDRNAHTTRAYILVDLSTSMRGYFDQIKENVISHIESLTDQDELVLITFGQTEVTTVLSGKVQHDEMIEVVRKLECNERGTMFFEALSRAYQMSSTSVATFDREYVIAFSDGIDYQIGSTTFEEVLQMYGSQNLPLYASCSSNTSKSASNQFGQIARASGGSLKIIKNAKMFEEFIADINDVTLIELDTASNRADGKEHQLVLKVGDSQVELNIPITRSVPDAEPPKVESVSYDAVQNVLIVRFSENVLGADTASAYKVVNSEGVTVRVGSVYYSEAEDQYELRLEEPVYNDTYSLSFSRITDDSQEANSLTEQTTIVVDNGLVPEQPQEEPPEEEPIALWMIVTAVILVILLILGIVLAAVAMSKKKKEETSRETTLPPQSRQQRQDEVYEYAPEMYRQVKHHIQAADKVRIRLSIRTGKTSEQNIEMELQHSLIIGRSQACDICIDDAKLSRQHFVIENDGGALYIMDLQSRNGTMVNGVRLTNRQMLHSSDKIAAGLSDIVVMVVG